jgi:hypothetical protein
MLADHRKNCDSENTELKLRTNILVQCMRRWRKYRYQSAKLRLRTTEKSEDAEICCGQIYFENCGIAYA